MTLLPKVASGLALVLMSAGVFAQAKQCTVTIGHIVPVTGDLADAGKDVPWVDKHKLDPINQAGGLQVGNEHCLIHYKIYDSKSSVAGSASAATQAILSDKVDFLIAQGSPTTTNAPSDLCERYGVPCVATTTPVEAWLYGPDGKPKQYKDTFEFFFSVVDLVKNHIGMIKSVPGGFNGQVGYLYPNDPDGTVFAPIFDHAVKAAGWTPTDPGRFSPGLPDFSSIINQFKRHHVEVVTGVLTPPDLQNFLQQAAQSGYVPKMYVVDKATGYPDPMNAIGQAGANLLSVNFWSGAFPGKSAYGSYDAQGLIDAYEKASGKQYIPVTGYNDAAFDVLLSALQRAGTTDRAAVLTALASTHIDSVVGPIAFNAQHYSVQPLGGAQWQQDPKRHLLVKQNVYNALYPDVRLTAQMQLYK